MNFSAEYKIQGALWTRIRHTLELVKFSHSVFALPFAMVAMILAAPGFPGWRIFGLLLLAMVSARSAAMGYNRWADAAWDAKNPRTANRHLPQGLLTQRYVLLFIGASAALFLWASYQLNVLAFSLAPLALFILLGYSHAKRFTCLSHFWLGFSLGIAPVAVWIALQETMALTSLLLCGTVTFWVAGFDILYATQDREFDREHRLHSIPARFGIPRALWIARVCHLLTLGFLAAFGTAASLHWFYWPLLLLIAAAFLWEHSLLSPEDLSRVNAAFFTVNGLVSLGFLAGMLWVYNAG